MEKFHLVNGVFLVTGAKNGALLNSVSGNVYAVNNTACHILQGNLRGHDYWERLVDMGLAECKVTVTDSHETDISPKLKQKLNFMWLEIVSDICNEHCVHCYANSVPHAYCNDGLRSLESSSLIKPPSRKILLFRKWIEIIREGYELGCREIQFIGGEPFLYRGEGSESVLHLAKFAREIGYEAIEIFTNATLLTTEKIKEIDNLGVKIAVSLYSNDPDIHDAITRTPGSHRLTLAALNKLQKAGISTRIEIIVMRLNEYTVESTAKLIQEMGFELNLPDVLRPNGRGENPKLFPSLDAVARYGLITAPSFVAVRESIIHNRIRHSCLAGKLAVSDNGDVFPCIFSRDQVIGNITLTSLEELVTSASLQAIWSNTKDNVLVCRDCEYRYICQDCRPISKAVAGENGDYFTAPYPRCTYNPYTGEWNSGVWRLDKNGQPYYDATYALEIKSV